jgi:hypothetical protein
MENFASTVRILALYQMVSAFAAFAVTAADAHAPASSKLASIRFRRVTGISLL